MRKPIVWVLLLVLVGGMATACRELPVQPSAVAASPKPRLTSPQVAPADLGQLVAGNTEFAFDLYQMLRQQPGNMFYSPYSISLALAMTYAGARGQTEEEMAQTLRFVLAQDALHAAFNALDQALAARGEGAAGRDGDGFRLNIVNAVWGQRDYAFLAEYLDTIAVNYGAGIRLVDFVENPEASRVTINDWVSDNTEGRIKDLIAPGLIDRLTRLVLTNAIYFNAAWMYPFAEGATVEGPFHLLDGGHTPKPMMLLNESLAYGKGEGYQVVELPYDGSELAMTILVPDDGRFAEFERSLDAARLGAISEGLSYEQVRLTLPRFEFESEFGLGAVLAEMGMPVAFSGEADFSGIDGSRNLVISEVVHKAFVAVDEAGTEAAAATAVIMRLTAMPAEPIELRVDRPFIFAIRDIATGALLFVGRVVE